MARYEVRITWLERGTNNAACAGTDETVLVEAENADAACKQAAEDAFDHNSDLWETGLYDLSADHLAGNECYSIEYEEA